MYLNLICNKIRVCVILEWLDLYDDGVLKWVVVESVWVKYCIICIVDIIC